MDNELNEAQKAAVEYCDGPSLVIAGAGSGKTRVITYKIAHLIKQGYDLRRILALTFTNKAANEMKSRIMGLGIEGGNQIWAGTFHSIFLRILRTYYNLLGFSANFTIYDASDTKVLIKTIIRDLLLDDKVYKPNVIQNMISNLKSNLISAERYEQDGRARAIDTQHNIPAFYAIYKGYCTRCKKANAMDFDDILYYMNMLLRDFDEVRDFCQNYFQYVLVDEYQDTNIAQHLIISQLCAKHHKLCVVGDDAQSIYSFRGANIQNILNLKSEYPELKVFKLEQNYRSTQTILNAANSLIEYNQQQIPKNIFTTNEKGKRIPVINAFSGYEESYIVANKIAELRMLQNDSFSDYAILYRTNAQSRMFEEALRKRNIPYKIYGGLSFYQRKEIKDVVAYMRLAVNPDDDEAVRRVINEPKRGIGQTTIDKLYNLATQKETSMWKVLCSDLINEVGVNGPTRNRLLSFVSLISTFAKCNEEGTNADELTQKIVHDTGIATALMNENNSDSRLENIQELISGTKEFVDDRVEQGLKAGVPEFLNVISLESERDNEEDDVEGGQVLLMTIHASKGLEFKNVFIVGLEENLFPSSMAKSSMRELEEERRLMYVALTRAKKNCTITWATTRYLNGQNKMSTKSRFISEIDGQYLQQQISASNSRFDSYSQGGGYMRYDDDRGSFGGGGLPQSFKAHAQSLMKKQSNMMREIQTPSTKESVEQIQVGQTVRHARFGVGKVMSIDQNAGSPKVVIDFDEVGQKTLLLLYAKLTIE